MISARRGPIPGTASLSSQRHPRNLSRQLANDRPRARIHLELALRRIPPADFEDLPYFASAAAHASDNAAAVPEVAITSCTLPG